MNIRTLLWLLLAVALLGSLAWWQSTREQTELLERDSALLEGFDSARVRALRVDNLERSLQMRIERAAEGGWEIVDPVRSPVEMAVLEVLFDALSTQRAKPAAVDDLAKVQLDPPRAVLEVEELIGGSLRTRRIEIGAVDLDGASVFVRCEGRLARTERGLETTLDRDLPGWRSHSVLSVAARDVVEVHRRGTLRVFDLEHPIDLTLDAVLDGTWRATAPFQAQLDPGAMGVLIGSVAMLRVESFVDVPGPLLDYGLEQPAIRIELVLANGHSAVVRLAPQSGSEMWYACCEGQPQVYRVAPGTVMMATPPSEGLIDGDLLRARADEIERVDLAYGGTKTTLTRDGKRWLLDATREGASVIASDTADGQLVGDLLGLLERTRFAQLLPERTLEESEILGAVHVLVGGELQGGVLGPEYRSADGGEGVLFRRDGDRLTVLLERRVLDVARADPDSWRSLELHRVPEIEVARIELQRAGAERTYVRSDKGQWCRRDSTVEAKEFAKLVDSILGLRATAILKRGFDDRLEDPLEVRVARYTGDVLEFTLADWTDPADGTTTAVYRTGQRFARVKPELASALRALLGQP